MQSWQMILLIVGLPGLAAAFLILLIPEPKRGHAPPAKTYIDNRALFVFLRRHWLYFTCHFVGFGMIAILAFGWAAWAPASAMRRFGMDAARSEEHTSELQSLMRNSYAVFCLKKKKEQ